MTSGCFTCICHTTSHLYCNELWEVWCSPSGLTDFPRKHLENLQLQRSPENLYAASGFLDYKQEVLSQLFHNLKCCVLTLWATVLMYKLDRRKYLNVSSTRSSETESEQRCSEDQQQVRSDDFPPV